METEGAKGEERNGSPVRDLTYTYTYIHRLYVYMWEIVGQGDDVGQDGLG